MVPLKMTKASLTKAFVGCTLALVLTGASAQDSQISSGAEMIAHERARWPFVVAPEGRVGIPVRAARELSGSTQLRVCTYPGGRPRTWEALRWSCAGGADYCTVFVAAAVHDEMLYIEYDIDNPPVAVASDEPCTLPLQPFAVRTVVPPAG